MAWRPAGLDPDSINTAMNAFACAASINDLESLIQDLPVVSSPYFHAILRQEYLRLSNAKDSQLQYFEPRYESLFMLLHFKLHQQLCQEAPLRQGEAHPHPVPFYAPPFYLEIAQILQDKTPSREGPIFNPQANLPEIQQELSSIVGRAVSLPHYQPTISSHWNAMLVQCAACQHEWLSFRAYAVDLTQAAELVNLVKKGSVNHSSCPQCGEELCFPLRLWIQDEPGVTDALGALSCIWRISDTLHIYQPPPGTPRIEANDRILEIRLSFLEKQIPFPISEQEEAENIIVTFGVAYSIEELKNYIEQAATPEEFAAYQLNVAVEDLCRKVQSGILPLHQAEEGVKKITQVNPNWPLVHPGDIRECGGLYYRYLFQSLIDEGLAEVRQEPAGLRALFAAATASAYLALNEVGLVESALARAEDLLANVPADDPDLNIYKAIVLEGRRDLAREVGEEEPAERGLELLSSMDILQGSEIRKRLARQGFVSQEALTYYETGEYAKALELFPQCVAVYRSLIQELASSNDPNEQQVLKSIRHFLSGDLANWAAVLTDLAKYLELDETLKSSSPGELDASHLDVNPEILGELIDSVTAELHHQFPEGFNSARLLTKAQNLLLEALELSKSVNGWEFAGIQAHRLIGIAKNLGDLKGAVEYAEQAIQYATKAGDHVRIWTSYAFLADQALQQRDGAAALNYLRRSAHDLIQNSIGLGFYAEAETASLTIADAALTAIEYGADAVEAIMILENLKAAKTAALLTSGVPLRGTELEQQPGIERYRELTQWREQLKLKLHSIKEPVKTLLVRELEQLQAAIDEERRQLSLRAPQFGRWVDATEIGLSDSRSLRNRLQSFGPKTTLMGLLPFQDKVWVYLIWADGYLVTKQPYVSKADFGSGEADEIDPPSYEEYLEQLATTLLEPLSERLDVLEPDDLLVISTYDQFSCVPFAALPYQDGYLCESVNIALVQGVGIFEACVSRPQLSLDSILTVGIGNFEQSDMDSLPGTIIEAERIFQVFKSSGKRSQKMVESDATIPQLKVLIQDYDIIHIACHGEASGDRSSRLLFAADAERFDSGELTEERIIYELMLKPGCLINLAGCTTGLQSGFNLPLLGGLVPAFLIAGASSVIASLWQIDDAAVANFQLEFYHRILIGESPAKALTHLQRLSIKGDLGAEMRDLEVWASFVLYGVG